MPMSRIGAGLGGSLSIRALATHVDHFIIDTGVTRIDTAGDVGDTSSIAGLPKWRGTLSIAYQGDSFGLDARVRYVDGGDRKSVGYGQSVSVSVALGGRRILKKKNIIKEKT